MISNSATHLRSYTNSAIANIARNSAPISPVTPRDRRRSRAERRRSRAERRLRSSDDVSASSDDVSALSDDVSALSDDVSASSADIVASNDLRAIADVAAPNADVSASSADIVASDDDCFMMFYNVLTPTFTALSFLASRIFNT